MGLQRILPLWFKEPFFVRLLEVFFKILRVICFVRSVGVIVRLLMRMVTIARVRISNLFWLASHESL